MSERFCVSILQELRKPHATYLIASVALAAIAFAVLLHATQHGAHANSATHCGFCTEMEAGLSCR